MSIIVSIYKCPVYIMIFYYKTLPVHVMIINNS